MKYTDPKVKNLVKKLSKTGWLSHRTRQSAARDLGKTGHPAAVQPLISALNDEDIIVRTLSAQSLGIIGNPAAVQPLIALLEDKIAAVRAEAARALGKIRNSVAVQPLVTALKDTDKLVRSKAAEALGNINNPGAVQPLVSALKDTDESGDVRKSAAEALGKTGDPGAVKPLISAFGDENERVRSSVVKALGKIGGQEALQPLISALRDQSRSVRCNATEALGNTGDSKAVKPLIFSMQDEYVPARWAAVEALGKIGDPAALKPLLKMLKYEKDKWGVAREEVYDFSFKLTGTINEIILSNRPSQKSYPHAYCRKCLMKTKQVKTGLNIICTNCITFFTSPMFVRYSKNIVICRHCDSGLHLMTNARQVVGLIGGDIEDFSVNEDRIYVSLWSESQKKARNADIDVLEIRNTQGISYDYAINALLITLKNDVSRPAEYVRQIPVIIHKNTKIPEGVKLVLDHEFGEIRWAGNSKAL